jgi:sorbitol/mannitol transport system substrate-binding protein
MYLKNALRAATALALVSPPQRQAETITIATVNNGDMIRMQGYTDDFTAKTGHEVEWVTLEENVLRQRVTTDITTKGGQFDIMTIGMYETPIWGANGWLVPLDDLSEEPTTSTTSCRRCAAASAMTARSMPRRSTAKAPWSCTAPT